MVRGCRSEMGLTCLIPFTRQLSLLAHDELAASKRSVSRLPTEIAERADVRRHGGSRLLGLQPYVIAR